MNRISTVIRVAVPGTRRFVSVAIIPMSLQSHGSNGRIRPLYCLPLDRGQRRTISVGHALLKAQADKEKEDKEDFAAAGLKEPKARFGMAPGVYEKFQRYMWINSGIAVVLCGMWLFYKGSSWMTGFSLSTFFKLGFISGCFTALGVAATAWGARNTVIIHADSVLAHVFKRATSDTVVQKTLGNQATRGDFIATTSTGGLWNCIRKAAPASLMRPEPRALQMMFQIRGTNGATAMVSCHCVKRRVTSSDVTYKSICVDFIETGERRILEGTEEDVIYKGHIRLR
eukprot:NODE_4577_length_1044_cov_114.147666_g4374_i0.p1 GENE.NODE_4577_length_1044_cov_114.147666_g4374_i0~~NODE_4577_length_1044_cov_114.147666_g4374_i0.p1  ORF type:complete len:306 (+),score=45.70 NODE_4577_length_1044_cov_114.147666_g4374_i0:64-918(+)